MRIRGRPVRRTGSCFGQGPLLWLCRQARLPVLPIRAEICGEQGKDWYEVLRERQREIETCRAMGMELPWFNPQMELTPIPPDEEEKEAKEE